MKRTHSAVGATRGHSRTSRALYSLVETLMQRILPEGCLWGTGAIFERRLRVLWLHLTSVWVAVGSVWLHQSTVGLEPQYCGPGPTVLWPGPTVLWVRLRAPRRGVKGTQPGGGLQVAFAAGKLHMRCACTMCVLLWSTLVGFDVSVGRLWVVPQVPFIRALWHS